MDLRPHRSERRCGARFDRSRRDTPGRRMPRLADFSAAPNGMAGLRHSTVRLHGDDRFVSGDVVRPFGGDRGRSEVRIVCHGIPRSQFRDR